MSIATNQLLAGVEATHSVEEEMPSTWLCLRPILRLFFVVLSTCVCFHPIVFAFAWLHPALELLSHLSLHVLAGSTGLLVIAALARRRYLRVVLFFSTCLLLWQTSAWQLLPSSPTPPTADETSYRILSWNLLATNENFDAIQALVDKHDPDLLILIEVRPRTLERLETVSAEYSHVLHRPSWGGEGIAVLSRIPNTDLRFEDLGFAKQPGIVAKLPSKLGSNARRLELLAVHTLSPLPLDRVVHRNRQLQLIGDLARTAKNPLVACGDFNITPWTKPFRDLLAAGFVDSRVGAGNGATWPSELGPFGVPIDHVLHHGHCRVQNRRVLDTVPGSDHRPILFEIIF